MSLTNRHDTPFPATTSAPAAASIVRLSGERILRSWMSVRPSAMSTGGSGRGSIEESRRVRIRWVPRCPRRTAGPDRAIVQTRRAVTARVRMRGAARRFTRARASGECLCLIGHGQLRVREQSCEDWGGKVDETVHAVNAGIDRQGWTPAAEAASPAVVDTIPWQTRAACIIRQENADVLAWRARRSARASTLRSSIRAHVDAVVAESD